MMKTIGKLATLALALTGIVHAADSKVSVDQSLPTYQTVSGITGNLNSVGSDTLNNLMTLWAEKFSAKYPSVKIGIEGKGSGTAP
ncbi:MAG: phosphate-binding protein, partial [Akkermansia sp.]